MDMEMDPEDEVLYLRPWTLAYLMAGYRGGWPVTRCGPSLRVLRVSDLQCTHPLLHCKVPHITIHTHARTHTNSSVTLHRGPGSLTFQGTGRFVKLSHAMPHQQVARWEAHPDAAQTGPSANAPRLVLRNLSAPVSRFRFALPNGTCLHW